MDDHEQKVIFLKNLISKELVLQIFDPSRPTLIQCEASGEASGEAFGSCLSQNNHPIVIASRNMLKYKKRWAQIDQKLGVIVFACEKMHYVIYGNNATEASKI